MNQIYNNQSIDFLQENISSKEKDSHYTFLIGFDKNSFEMKFKSSSKWYRTFSNSNQITGYKSNRHYWNENFIGGKYNTLICENEIILHFLLEMKKPQILPNELGLKLRIGKSSKGLKFELILNKPHEIKEKLLTCDGCNSTIRNIGDWYYENYQSKLTNKESSPQL
jgi:hypothetical protein